MRSRTKNRVQALEATLGRAGLVGRVRVGVPVEPLRPAQAQEVEITEESTSILSLDGLLRPLEAPGRGQLIEIAGGPSSGRTALAYRMVAGTTIRGGLVGWVDFSDALDPRSLRRTGTELRSLLWARPRGVKESLRCAELLLRTGFDLVVLDLEGTPSSLLNRLASPVWTRLLRAARGARSTALLLVTERVAGAAPTLGLWTERREALFERGLFEGIEARASVVRDRAGPTGMEHSFRALQRPEGDRKGRHPAYEVTRRARRPVSPAESGKTPGR